VQARTTHSSCVSCPTRCAHRPGPGPQRHERCQWYGAARGVEVGGGLHRRRGEVVSWWRRPAPAARRDSMRRWVSRRPRVRPGAVAPGCPFEPLVDTEGAARVRPLRPTRFSGGRAPLHRSTLRWTGFAGQASQRNPPWTKLQTTARRPPSKRRGANMGRASRWLFLTVFVTAAVWRQLANAEVRPPSSERHLQRRLPPNDWAPIAHCRSKMLRRPHPRRHPPAPTGGWSKRLGPRRLRCAKLETLACDTDQYESGADGYESGSGAGAAYTPRRRGGADRAAPLAARIGCALASAPVWLRTREASRPRTRRRRSIIDSEREASERERAGSELARAGASWGAS